MINRLQVGVHLFLYFTSTLQIVEKHDRINSQILDIFWNTKIAPSESNRLSAVNYGILKTKDNLE